MDCETVSTSKNIVRINPARPAISGKSYEFKSISCSLKCLVSTEMAKGASHNIMKGVYSPNRGKFTNITIM